MLTAILNDTLYCGFDIFDNKKVLLVTRKFSQYAEANLYHTKDIDDLKNYLGEYGYLLNEDVERALDMNSYINLVVDDVL